MLDNDQVVVKNEAEKWMEVWVWVVCVCECDVFAVIQSREVREGLSDKLTLK